MRDYPCEESVFGRWLQRRRRTLDLTQKELAGRLGCSVSTVRKMEYDERRPSKSVAMSVAELFGIPEQERPAFVGFARRGWADTPPDTPAPLLERPWAFWCERREARVIAAPPRAAPAPAALPDVTPPTTESTALLARDAELQSLDAALSAALEGNGRVMLVAGDAGEGKTALMTAFADRAHRTVPELLVASGSCNAFTGEGDPFLPFRQIIMQLTGDVPLDPGEDAFESARTARLRAFGATGAAALLEQGPHVAEAFVPHRLPGPRHDAEDSLHTWGTAHLVPDRWNLSGAWAARQEALRSETAVALARMSRVAPLLLLLDDLQWADASSLEILWHLARTVVAHHRLLIVGAYRPDPVGASREQGRTQLERLADELRRLHGDTVLDLGHADARAFLEAWVDSEPNALGASFRDGLWRQTGGHPLFTIELVRAMQGRGDLVRDAAGRWTAATGLRWDAVPERISGVIAEHVGRLGAFARRVVSVASVEGTTFTAEVVAEVLGCDVRDVVLVMAGELQHEHRLVDAVDMRRTSRGRLLSRHRFRHDLMHRYVYDRLGDNERGYLHGAVAGALEALLGEDADPVALANHYERAQAPERAALHQREAGDRARRFGALGDAVHYYRRALAHWPDPDSASRAALLRDLGECQCLLGEGDEGLCTLEEARDAFEAAGDLRAAGSVQASLGRALFDLGELPRAFEACYRALAILEQGPDTPELAMAISSISMLHKLASNDDEAIAWGERALEMAARVHADEVPALTLANVGYALVNAGPARREQGLRLLAESHTLSDRLGLVHFASGAAYNLGARYMALGRFEEARRQLRHTADYNRRHQIHLMEPWPLLDLWRLDWRCGRWRGAFEALPKIEALVQDGEPMNAGQAFVLIRLAAFEVDIGRVLKARALLDRHGSALERVAELQRRIPYLRERLRIAVALGDAEEADRREAQMFATLGSRHTHCEDVIAPVLTALRWSARRGTGSSRPSMGLCLTVLEQVERQFGSSEASAAAAEGRGTLAASRGEEPAAAAELLRAATLWKACGFPLDEAGARCVAAQHLLQVGKPDDAEAQLHQADELLAGLAAQIPDPAVALSFLQNRRHSMRPFGRPARVQAR